jgi:predicted PurR-regulated permease PerM
MAKRTPVPNEAGGDAVWAGRAVRSEERNGTVRAALDRPRDFRNVMLTGIFVLLLFYTLYVTGEIVVPLVFAVLLKLLLQPAMRALGKLRVPQAAAALATMVVFFGLVALLVYAVAGPAASWVGKAPESLPRIEQRLTVLKRPIDRILNTTQQVERMTEAPGAGGPSVTLKGPGLSEYLFSGTRSLLTGLGITVLLLFFLLAAGDLFMRRLVEILPTFRDKKQAVEISHEIERNISAYLVTITLMNALVGGATGLAMYAIGIADPVLWGAIAFALNYVLILGPATGVVLFFVVGLLSFDTLWAALLPPAVYLCIHIAEGEVVTPMLLARRFTLNPVLVIGSLIFWDWMWGIPGALLAVPMLATFKIVCDRVEPLRAVGHFIEG